MGKQWWLLDLEHDLVPGHHVVQAANGRAALASFRADMVQHFQVHDSKRRATDRVRVLHPIVIAGPLTAAEAFRHEVGWRWAWQITDYDSRHMSVLCEPAAPADRETAVRFLGEQKTAQIEAVIAEDTGVTLPG